MNVYVSSPQNGFGVTPKDIPHSLATPLQDIATDTASANQVGSNSLKKQIGSTLTTRKKRSTQNIRKLSTTTTNLSKLTLPECTVSPGRRVHFLIDENGNIVNEYATMPDIHHYSKKDLKHCWWSKKDLQMIREQVQEACHFYLTCRPEYKMAAFRMLDRCGAQKSGCSCELDPELSDGEFNEEDDLSTLVDGGARGIEKRLINAMNLPFYRHKRCVSAVLNTQKRTRTLDQDILSAEQRVRLIALQYGLHSRYASVWARMIADGDANAVARNFQFSV